MSNRMKGQIFVLLVIVLIFSSCVSLRFPKQECPSNGDRYAWDHYPKRFVKK